VERLRILHTESSLGWGGQEIRVLTEARALARRGHAMTIAAPAESLFAKIVGHAPFRKHLQQRRQLGGGLRVPSHETPPPGTIMWTCG